MSEGVAINKNSKLYQKFLEKKGKKQPEDNQLQNQSMSDRRGRCQSDYRPPKIEESQIKKTINQVYGDENVDTSNIPKVSTKNDEKLNALLKRQLQRKRNEHSMISKMNSNEKMNQKQVQLNLENNYLRAQNQKLRQKLSIQVQKYIKLQQKLQEQRQKSTKLQQQLYNVKKQVKNEHNQNKNLADLREQIKKLQQQNHLAKDYLYKLTLKLYQSQQQNQKLKKQIETLRKYQKQETYMNQPERFQMKTSRNRQFLNSRQESIRNTVKLASQETSPQKSSSYSKQHRMQEVQRQLQQLNTLKVFNGKNRRRKIQLQRQLQQLKLI